jgi:hypothetical protein
MCISLRLRQIVFIAAAVLALGFAAPASALVVKETSGPGQSALAGKGNGVWKKADYRLRRIYAQFLQHEQQGKTTSFSPHIARVQVANGMILIDATAVSDSAQLLADLERLGLNRSARYGAMVSGWIPLGKLDQAVALGSLRSISASLKPMSNAGAVTSQGVAAMNATTLGFDGAGVTVGILSDTYNQNTSAPTNASQDIASGDLPAGGVNVLEEGPSGGTDEGRAMLQIVHDVAPGASLAFHTAFNGMADFAQGIVDLANAGATVIADDATYFAEPMFQDGIIAQAVDTVKNNGVAYFSAAGNSARRSYQHAFVDSGEHLYVQSCFITCSLDDRGPMHDFDPGSGVNYEQSITIPDGSTLYLSLQWDQPFASVSPGHGAQTDLDIYLVDSNFNIVAEATSDNIQSGDPVEVLQYPGPMCQFMSCPGGTYYLIITDYTGPQPDLMKYVLFPPFNITVNDYTTDSSTSYGHANAAGAEAVGAAEYFKTPAFDPSLSAAELSSFSSAGGTPILFNTNGNLLSSPVYRNKPEIVAPDGGNTTFFYPGQDYEGDGWPNFFGTSAAAPHAAGVAAVMKSANSALSPAQIYGTLENTAVDMTKRCLIGDTSLVSCEATTDIPIGFDYDSGFGFIQADQAVAAVTGGSSPPPTPRPTCSLTLDATSITQGGTGTRLNWSTTDATDLTIDQGIGSVALPSGSTPVNPPATTTYTGTVTGDGGTNTCSATLTVNPPPPTANLGVSLSGTPITLSRSSTTNNHGMVGVTVTGPDSDTVNLAVSGLPNSVTPSWSPSSTISLSGGSATATLYLSANKHGPSGSWTVTVTGTDQSSNNSQTFLLTVTK